MLYACIVAQLFSSVLHSCTLFISWKACHMRGACRPTQTSVRLSVEPTTSCCPSVRPSALPAQRLATWMSQHSSISSRNQDFCRLLLRRLRNAVWVFYQPEIAKRFPGSLQSSMVSNNAVHGNVWSVNTENCEGCFRPPGERNDVLKLPLDNTLLVHLFSL